MKKTNINKMGENQHHGPVPTLISILFGSFALITMKDIQVWMSITSAAVAIVSGGFAIRYYVIKTRETKKM